MGSDAARVRWARAILAATGAALPGAMLVALSYATVADSLRAHVWGGMLAVLDFQLGPCPLVWLLLACCGAMTGAWFGEWLVKRKGT